MNKPSQDNIELKIKYLEEENELLLLQLHQVQEELEKYFIESKDLESRNSPNKVFIKDHHHSLQAGNSSLIRVDWIDDRLPVALAEINRLTTLIEAHEWVNKIDLDSGLNSRLAKLLIDSIKTPAGIFQIPLRLIRFWWAATNKTPPSVLGKKDYENLISVLREKGVESAEALIESGNLSHIIKANAYTVLARYLRKQDVKTSAKLAQLAYEFDPHAYRLKWLAFRLHEAGEKQMAEALISLLPGDVNFSGSEDEHVDRIRYEAKLERIDQAKDRSQYSSGKQKIQEQLTQLAISRDTQAQLAQERRDQIEVYKRSQDHLQEQLTQLAISRDTQAQLAQERGDQIEVYKRSQDHLQEQLTQLAISRDTQAQLAQERGDQIEVYKRSQDHLQEQLTQLAISRDTQAQLAQERGDQIEVYKRSQDHLQEQLTQLAISRDTQAQLAQERGDQIEVYKRSQDHLQEQLTQLAISRDTQAQLAQERGDQIEVYKRSLKERLEVGSGFGNLIQDFEPFFYKRSLTYVDIGAYVGKVFLEFANSKLKIREAHLIEPNRESFDTLVKNTSSILNVQTIKNYHLAISDSAAELAFTPGKSMTKVLGTFDGLPSSISQEGIFITKSITLDSLVDSITEKHIDILKIDVEGFELDVLRGAQSSLKLQRMNIIIIEVGMNPDGTQQCFYQEIDNLLREFKYKIFKIYDQMNEWLSDSPILRRANFVYMSEKFSMANPYRLSRELYDQNKLINELRLKNKTGPHKC